MYYKKTIISIALLLPSVTISAQQKAPDMEQQLVQRLQEAQMSGNDSEFYKAQDDFLRYLEKYNEWDKYYRTGTLPISCEICSTLLVFRFFRPCCTMLPHLRR